MAIKFTSNLIEFSSGRIACINLGTIGIDLENGIHYGYDGPIEWPPWNEDAAALTPDDMRELADAMIARWQAFKDSLPK